NIFILLTPLIYLVNTMNGMIAEAISNNEPFTERLREYPPSVKLVFKTLENNGTMTLSDIEKETYLPYRTVRYAVKRLKEGGVCSAHLSHRRCTTKPLSPREVVWRTR